MKIKNIKVPMNIELRNIVKRSLRDREITIYDYKIYVNNKFISKDSMITDSIPRLKQAFIDRISRYLMRRYQNY